MGRSNRIRIRAAFGILALFAVILPWSSIDAQNGPGRTKLPGAGRKLSALAPQPTDQTIVRLKPGADAQALARKRGLRILYQFKSDPNIYVMAAGSLPAAARVLTALRNEASVRWAMPNRRLPGLRPHSFVPNDPYFPKAAGWPTAADDYLWGQWHLINQHGTGIDARLQGAWNRDVTGAAVRIGIADDGLEHLHPDLSPNYNATDSWDFVTNDADPSPTAADQAHGTSVAGVAAARGGNGIGVTGAAPYASISGLRLPFDGTGTDAQFMDATLFHSNAANSNLQVKNHSYGFTDPFIDVPTIAAALNESIAAGAIHVYSAGNSRLDTAEDANKQHLLTDPGAIVVAALGSDGVFASYSSFGANVTVTAPSNTDGGLGIITTDRLGAFGYNGFSSSVGSDYRDYTPFFGGTSSAAPLVSGIAALVKQVHPDLNARFLKHLLARTSDLVDQSDGSVEGGGNGTSGSAWKTNNAGFRYNQNYGFGLIDADELTQVAGQYSGPTPLETESTGTIAVNAELPDHSGDTDGVLTRTFNINATSGLEEVMVTMNVTHTYRGDLEAYLTSPVGTRHRLFLRHGADSVQNLSWTFVANGFWGENPNGTWTLELHDTFDLDTGTWNSFKVDINMGSLFPAFTQMTVSPTSATPSQFVTASWTAASPESGDWVGLYPAGAPDSADPIWWHYTFGAGSGSFNVRAPFPAGHYNFRYFRASDNERLAFSNPFTVEEGAGLYTVSVSPSSVTAGGTVTVDWTSPVPTSNWDWVGLFAVGADADQFLSWAYTRTRLAGSGSRVFTVPLIPGQYEIRYYLDNGFLQAAVSSTFTVTAP